MTHAPVTGAINRLFFSGAAPVSGRPTCVIQIWDRIRLVPDSDPEQNTVLIQFCSKPESGVRVTEIIIYDLFLFNLPLTTIPCIINNSGSLGEFIFYVAVSHVCFQ